MTSALRFCSGRKFIRNRSVPNWDEPLWLSQNCQRSTSRASAASRPPNRPVVSVIQFWMAPDWLRVKSSATRTGASPIGFSARYAGLRAAPLKKSTQTGSQSRPARVRGRAAL